MLDKINEKDKLISRQWQIACEVTFNKVVDARDKSIQQFTWKLKIENWKLIFSVIQLFSYSALNCANERKK